MGAGAIIIYMLHFWVERRFKIDNAVGTVALQSYAGWRRPASDFEGYAVINPLVTNHVPMWRQSCV